MKSEALPCEYKAASPETMYSAIYGIQNNNALKSRIYILCRHDDERVKDQAFSVFKLQSSKVSS